MFLAINVVSCFKPIFYASFTIFYPFALSYTSWPAIKPFVHYDFTMSATQIFSSSYEEAFSYLKNDQRH